MIRSLGRCRTGLLILAGALVATGLSAREVRGLRVSDTTARGVVTTPSLPIAIDDIQAPSLDIQLEELYSRLKSVSDVRPELGEPFGAYAEALRAGSLDDAAIWACISTIADVQVQDKYEGIMRDFAQRVLAGQMGFELETMPEDILPLAMRGQVLAPELRPGYVQPKNLCNTCATASGNPPPSSTNPAYTPTATCQYITGDVVAGCSDYYKFDLVAGTPYFFTLCTATCVSAGAGTSDTMIYIYDPACTQVAVNDDFCSLRSEVSFTPATSGTYKVRVTGYLSGAVPSYTLGYKTGPPPSPLCGSCFAPVATITPTTTCQTVNGSNSTCPSSSTATSTSGGVWYNVNLTAGRSYTFSTCPNNAAGGTCFGTATYDTRLDLWNSTCTTLLATNDDVVPYSNCSLQFRSALAYTPTSSGVYKMQVRGFSSTSYGTYTLGYQEAAACSQPTVTSASPTSVSTSATNCSTSAPTTFSVTLSGLSALGNTVNWTITPPPGGTAVPATGTFTNLSSRTLSWTSTLTKPACGGIANFAVSAVIAPTCNPSLTRTHNWTVQLRDLTAPTIVGCSSASIQLDCAAGDPPAPTFAATDNCDFAPTVTFSETRVAGTCPGNFTTRRTWTARDCNANTRTCTQNLNHRDVTPPTVTGSDQWCLYPTNHEYYCLQTSSLNVVTTDNCSPPVSVVVVGCVSSEPDEGTGDGDFPNDCVVSPDGKEVCLRSERSGNLRDRIYGILGVAIDACGNRSAPTPIALVTVPHDDSEHPECRQPNSGLDKHF